MEDYLDEPMDQISRVLSDIASARAREKQDQAGWEEQPYVDTGLTPEQLHELCLVRLTEDVQRAVGTGPLAPVVKAVMDRGLHERLFWFYVSVEVAMGNMRVLTTHQGEPHVFVARQSLTAPTMA